MSKTTQFSTYDKTNSTWSPPIDLGAKAENVEFNNNKDLETLIDDLQSSVANVEDSSISSREYKIDEYLMYNNKFYKATSDIPIGGTIIPGTNVTSKKIADEISENGDLSQVITYEQWQQLTPEQQNNGDYYITNWPVNPQGFDTVPTAGSENPVTSDGIKTALDGKISTSILGIAGGVAQLDDTGRVPSSQLPSGGGGSVCFLGTCDTVASTAAKTVTVSDPNYTLKTGTEIVVQFTYTNTAQNPTISVNGGAAKSIYYGSQVVTTEKLDIAAGTAGEYVRYVYDGTYWVWIGHGKDIDAGHTILDSSGTVLAQEESLQFSGLNVSDDPTNGKTIVHGQLVKVTSAEYEALSAAAKNDPNVTYEVTDTQSAESIASTITISTSGWSNSTTTVDSVAYYTHETALATVFDSHPDIYLGALSTFPTTAEKQAYMAVDYITVDSATNKLKCYARSKPSADFVIIVKGVSV